MSDDDKKTSNSTDMWAEALEEQEKAEQKPESSPSVAADDWAAAMNEQAEHQPTDSAIEQATHIAEEAIPSLDAALLREMEVEVTIELGRTQMPLKDIYELNQGSVIELPKDSKQPLVVYINGLPLLKGEVVTVNRNFGLLVTEKINKLERAQNLSFTHENK